MPRLFSLARSYYHGLRFRFTRRLSDRHPEELWPGISQECVTIAPFAGQFGNVKRYELLLLSAVVRHVQARAIFEFGTFDGLTTWHLAANAPTGARIWSLDLPLDHPARTSSHHDRTVGKIQGITVGGYYHGTKEAAAITQVLEDSLQFDPTTFQHRIDFCFIDASHEYQHVLNDTVKALKLVRPGGHIFWHDYSRWWPGVQRCLDDLATHVPVYRLFDTALAVTRLPLERTDVMQSWTQWAAGEGVLPRSRTACAAKAQV